MRNHYLYQFTFFLLLELLLIPQWVFSAQSDAPKAGAYKCWIDEDEVTTCGNVVPPEISQKGFNEFNDQGILTSKVNAAPTAAEIAAFKQKEEEVEKRKQQQKEDRALLDLFSTEQDIERARVAILATIDGQIHSIETIVASLEKNLVDMEKNLVDSVDNPDVSESQLQTIKKNIEDVKYRIKSNRDTLKDKFKEKEDVNKEYNEYLQRYRDIKRRGLPPKAPEEGEGKPAEVVDKP